MLLSPSSHPSRFPPALSLPSRTSAFHPCFLFSLSLHNHAHCYHHQRWRTSFPHISLPHSWSAVLRPLPRSRLHFWEHADIFWLCPKLQTLCVLRTGGTLHCRQGDAEMPQMPLAAKYVALDSIDILTKASGPAEMLFFSGQQTTWARQSWLRLCL